MLYSKSKAFLILETLNILVFKAHTTQSTKPPGISKNTKGDRRINKDVYTKKNESQRCTPLIHTTLHRQTTKPSEQVSCDYNIGNNKVKRREGDKKNRKLERRLLYVEL